MSLFYLFKNPNKFLLNVKKPGKSVFDNENYTLFLVINNSILKLTQ